MVLGGSGLHPAAGSFCEGSGREGDGSLPKPWVFPMDIVAFSASVSHLIPPALSTMGTIMPRRWAILLCSRFWLFAAAQLPLMVFLNISHCPGWEAARCLPHPRLSPLAVLHKLIPAPGSHHFSSALGPTQKDIVDPLAGNGLIFSVPGPLFSFHSLSQYHKAPKTLAIFTKITAQ